MSRRSTRIAVKPVTADVAVPALVVGKRKVAASKKCTATAAAVSTSVSSPSPRSRASASPTPTKRVRGGRSKSPAAGAGTPPARSLTATAGAGGAPTAAVAAAAAPPTHKLKTAKSPRRVPKKPSPSMSDKEKVSSGVTPRHLRDCVSCVAGGREGWVTRRRRVGRSTWGAGQSFSKKKNASSVTAAVHS